MNNYFLVKIKYEKTGEEGKIVKVSELYLVDAITFTESEERIIKEMTPFISGEFIVVSITRYKVNEIFSQFPGDTFFKVKVNFISLDEIKGVEKKTTSFMLVVANDIKEAEKNFTESMKSSMADYSVEKIEETKILEIFKFETK